MIEDTTDAFREGGVRKISPFFVPGLDHQHGRGARVDPLRLSGPEPRDRQRVLDGQPQPRRGGAAHRIRRRRRHGRRRRRVDGEPARRRRLLRRARAVDAQRRSRHRVAGRGTATATASCWARAPACWCSRRYEHAKARGATIYCELAGYGMSADAHHITAPPEDGRGAARSMRNALRNAQHESRRHRLHQRARHVDAARRHRRVRRGQARVRRPREEARGELDQVDDRSPARRRRRHRGGVHGARGARPGRAADREPRRPRSAVRPRFRSARPRGR